MDGGDELYSCIGASLGWGQWVGPEEAAGGDGNGW